MPARRKANVILGRNLTTQPSEFFSALESLQPEVFARLERSRADLWTDPARFDGGCTLLCLTHRAAQLWPSGVPDPGLAPPNFDPWGPASIMPPSETVSA